MPDFNDAFPTIFLHRADVEREDWNPIQRAINERFDRRLRQAGFLGLLPEKLTFIIDADQLGGNRRYKHPGLTRVGPVRSGSLREFEDEEPAR